MSNEIEAAESCANCYFCRGNPKNLRELTCRANPIQPLIVPSPTGQIDIKGYFPPTDPSLWCGRWRAKWPKGN